MNNAEALIIPSVKLAPYIDFDVFVDSSGLLRVEGRLNADSMDDREKTHL